jgi:hypothetical protein
MALSASAETSVTAIFNPPRIALGDRAQYIVEIKESSGQARPEPENVTSLPIPQSGGLELTNGRISSSQQTRIINGVAEYSVTQQLIIDAKAPRVGEFTIPTYTFQYKGETLRAPAATLSVVERPADAAPTTDELIFLKTDTPRQLYLGQTTQIQLKLYISESVRLTGLNSFDRSADGFAISELPDSQETVELFNGRRYRVLTWPITITPIQNGEQDLNFQFTVSANVPGQNDRSDPFGRRGFGSSIFDDFFGRSERFTIYTEPTTVEVRPLPTADQPVSFTGAIGDFAIEVSTDRDRTQAGEPIMLSVEISGRGNFDRITAPVIPESADWRSYEPEASFQPRSEGNVLRGTKRFDYIMIPNKAGSLEIPGIEFAYFEPGAKRYSQLNTPPIPIEVSPSTRAASPPPTANQTPLAQPVNALPLQREMSMEEALLTLDYRPKASTQGKANLWQSPGFWASQALIALALIGSAIWLRRRRRLAEDPVYASRLKAKTESRDAAKAAQQASDAAAAYAHAQTAIRLAMTSRSGQNLRTANSRELTAAMQRSGIDADTIEATHQLFAAADALRFAGNAASTDPGKVHLKMERILKAI